MTIQQNDLDIIMSALQTAIENETDDGKLLSYRDVLKRLSGGSMAGAVSLEDGFRYDYDDTTDLFEGNKFHYLKKLSRETAGTDMNC